MFLCIYASFVSTKAHSKHNERVPPGTCIPFHSNIAMKRYTCYRRHPLFLLIEKCLFSFDSQLFQHSDLNQNCSVLPKFATTGWSFERSKSSAQFGN